MTFRLLASILAIMSAAAASAQSPENASSGRELPESSAALDFIVFNRTGRTITGLAITPQGEESWSVDILAPRDLPDGERGAASYTRDVELCSWAIRATFEGGQTRIFTAVNLCDTIRVELR